MKMYAILVSPVSSFPRNRIQYHVDGSGARKIQFGNKEESF